MALTIREGWVVKAPPLGSVDAPSIKSWQRRMLRLTAAALSYYDGGDALKGEVYLREVTHLSALVLSTKRNHVFGVHTADRTYYFESPGDVEREAWVKAVTEACVAGPDHWAFDRSLAAAPAAAEAPEVAIGPPPLVYDGQVRFEAINQAGGACLLVISYPRLDLIVPGRGCTQSWPLAHLNKHGLRQEGLEVEFKGTQLDPIPGALQKFTLKHEGEDIAAAVKGVAAAAGAASYSGQRSGSIGYRQKGTEGGLTADELNARR